MQINDMSMYEKIIIKVLCFHIPESTYHANILIGLKISFQWTTCRFFSHFLLLSHQNYYSIAYLPPHSIVNK